MEKYTEYDRQADEFLSKYRLGISTRLMKFKPPQWAGKESVIGKRYRVTIKRLDKQGETISFEYWNSFNDAQNGVEPSHYDILTCVSSDAFAPTDPDEVCECFGDVRPSHAIKIANAAKKFQAFFTKEELDDLGEIV